MARAVSEQTERIEIRIRAADKARINRAASLVGLDLTSFIRQQALEAANLAIEREERIAISERDARRWIEYLEAPLEPNERLLEAARSLPKDALR